ncbi:MAG: PIN domain-containing protein [Gemmataceae bacterium]|nr:PIN domain-containing protein [Gemmataceae bacterium]
MLVSDLSLSECLVGPFLSGDKQAEASYRTFFADPDIGVLQLAGKVWENAARIRADKKFELVDLLHLATAIENGCGLF